MLESWHVVLRCCGRLLLVGGAVTYSALAPALGLGEITQHSALNQPFNADIALVDAGGLEEGELSVSLATADEFSRAGVERVFFLNDLKFTPILRGNRSLIRVTSSKPVKEPFLNFSGAAQSAQRAFAARVHSADRSAGFAGNCSRQRRARAAPSVFRVPVCRTGCCTATCCEGGGAQA